MMATNKNVLIDRDFMRLKASLVKKRKYLMALNFHRTLKQINYLFSL
jgi:hypothetical protein